MKKILFLILCLSVFSCKTDNSISGEIDGVWLSNRYNVEIRGNIGLLTQFTYNQEINGEIAQVGDTILRDLRKSKANEFVGIRLGINSETAELQFDTATFKIQQEKETQRLFMTSISKHLKDTIIFELRIKN